MDINHGRRSRGGWTDVSATVACRPGVRPVLPEWRPAGRAERLQQFLLRGRQLDSGSVAALESFRAALLVFLTHARASVDEARGDVLRTRLWLENDQTRHWENQLRVRGLVLERAQAEMFGARMSKFGGDVQEKQAAVRRAKLALAEAEEKMKLLKKSERELDHDSEPLLKQVEKLQGFLSGDMGLAVVQLNEFIKVLEAYAGVAARAPKKPEAAA